MNRNFSFLKLLIIALSMIVMAGCESGGNDDSEPHDFGENDPNLIGCTGDSITAGVYGTPYPTYLRALTGRRVINSGAPGQRVRDGVTNARSVLARRPGYLVIMFGTNDIIHGGDIEYIIENLQNIIQFAKNQQTIPIIMTLTPGFDESHQGWEPGFDALSVEIRALAKMEKIAVVDLDKRFGDDRTLIGQDGLHPTDEGNMIIAEMVADKIK